MRAGLAGEAAQIIVSLAALPRDALLIVVTAASSGKIR
jgi:hypothetical protein